MFIITHRQTDTLNIDNLPLTKRSVASAAARLFDVMGWYGALMLTIQLKLKLPWDTPDQLSMWEAWSKVLHILSMHPVPRQHSSPVVERQLHLFTDGIWWCCLY